MAKAPLVAEESFVAGQQWGQYKANEIINRLRAEGFKPTEI